VVAELRGILASALASDRLELCLQPVVELPQRKIRGYEATLRLSGEGGDLQSEADLRRIAATTGLEADLDRVLVDRALHVLRVLRGRKRTVTISCAVTVKGLLAPNLPPALETALRSDPELAKALILEFSDQEFRALTPDARLELRALAGRGVGLSLGRLPHLKLDMDSITAIGIRQIKVSASAMLGEAHGDSSQTDIHPADMSEFLRRRGIELQMFDVASEQTVIDSLEYAPPLASGPLFGAARPVRPEVIEPRAVSDAGVAESRKAPQMQAEREQPSAQSGRPQRQSFRSVLRRA
jgi:cyclic-di-GMP phosphodiesterase TipF (flagellum assembly factor)